MRVVVTELRKLFGSRIFLLIIAAAVILNGYLMFRTADSGDVKPEQYRAVYAEIDGMTDSDKLKWLDDQLSDFSQQPRFSWGAMAEIRDDLSAVLGYGDYLDSIDAQAKSMTSVSIFAKPDTFNYRSIVKTPPAYDRVRGVKPVFGVSKGIVLATDNSFTDILCGFAVLFAVLNLMIADREQGMSGLLFALKRGRGHLLAAKLMALAVTILGAVLLMYGENLVIGQMIFGLGDLSRPIQSVSGFIGCNLKISVAQYLMIYAVSKFAAIFAIGTVLSLIAVNTRNTVSFYGISAAVLIAEGALYGVIHPLSVYSIFRYVNLIAFTRVNGIFSNFRNINFWEHPIPLIPVSVGAMTVIVLTCAVLSAVLYAKKRNLEFRKVGFKLKSRGGGKVRSAVFYELYKSLVLQKGLVFIAIFGVITGVMYHSFVKQYDYVDAYYEYYANLFEGETIESAGELIESESARFEELSRQLAEMEETVSGYSAAKYELQKQLAPKAGFDILRARYELIRDIPGARLFYDTGYRRAMGLTGYDDDMKYALAAVLLCVFLVSPLAANDNRCRMDSVINATRSGRKSYIRRNIGISAGYGVLAVLMWIVPYAAVISLYYGHGGLSGNVRSIAEMVDFPLNMAVWQYLLLICAIRSAAVIVSALVMLKISSLCRNVTTAVLVNFAVFALPVIVYLLGADVMVNIGFSPLLSANAILNQLTQTKF